MYARDPFVTGSNHLKGFILFFQFQPEFQERKGNVLFNDALNTFYLRLYGIRHMVKDHSDSERGNPQGFFYMTHPTDRITHTTAFVAPVVEHWLERPEFHD